MDFSIYIDSIIDKLKEANFYSEINEDELRYRISEHLRQEYNSRVEVAAFEFDVAEVGDNPQSVEEVKQKMSGIKNEIITIVRELAKTKL